MISRIGSTFSSKDKHSQDKKKSKTVEFRSPAQGRTATTSGHEATRDDPMPGSSDDDLRQPTTETDVLIRAS